MNVRYNMVNCFVVRPDQRGTRYEFLQLRRRADDFMGGTWQTVYGESVEGETAVVAALRELKEEAGLEPREFYRLEKLNVFYIVPQNTIWHCVQFCAIVGSEDQVTLNEEHDAFRWIGAEHAKKEFMWQSDRNAVEEILNEILNNGPAKPHVRILPEG